VENFDRKWKPLTGSGNPQPEVETSNWKWKLLTGSGNFNLKWKPLTGGGKLTPEVENFQRKWKTFNRSGNLQPEVVRLTTMPRLSCFPTWIRRTISLNVKRRRLVTSTCQCFYKRSFLFSLGSMSHSGSPICIILAEFFLGHQ
jgi:hypothetical protein